MSQAKEIKIQINNITLKGILDLTESDHKVVIFAHGSGSSRFSPRNTFVAKRLKEAGFGTLLFDLLTEEEDLVYENRFNILLLGERLVKTTEWLKNYLQKDVDIGYFGASTGAAAALEAGAILGHEVSAIVSRGGRPDLAMKELEFVKSPTLLIVGSEDLDVLDLNQKAYDQLKCTKQLSVVRGATHLFEEPGALEQVADLAIKWLEENLVAQI